MRDPARIARILRLVQMVWEQQPDIRLGQLIMNTVNSVKPSAVYNDVINRTFSLDDDQLELRLKKQLGLLDRLAIESDEER